MSRLVPELPDTLRLAWRRTWASLDGDYTANAEGFRMPVGRVVLMRSGPREGQWAWSMTAEDYDVSRGAGPTQGHGDSAPAAAAALEDSWFRAIRGSRYA